MKSFILLIVTFSICSKLIGQKKFDVVFSFPDSLSLTRLNIQVDNGFGRTSVPFDVKKNNKVKLSDFYYSKYAAIILSYPKTNNWTYRSFFFLDEKPASVQFLPATKDSSPLDHYILNNAIDFKWERNKIDSFDAAEIAEAKAYYEKYDSLIFNGTRKDISDHFTELDHRIYQKDIKYINGTSNSYFSFWHFRSNVQYSGLPADSIMKIFNDIFPVEFKNSIEGNAFKQLLLGRIKTKKGMIVAPFNSRDINGNTVSLSAFKNKKYVLLDFWATWCGPCIKKMPFLNELRKKFGNNLEIISIAYPTSLSEVKKVIVAQKMKWINIYNDRSLIDSFGGMGAIPRLFLIDKTGKIIYDNQEEHDTDLTILDNILERNF